MTREPTGAPRLAFEVALALGFAALMVWALPDIAAWLRGAPPVTAMRLSMPPAVPEFPFSRPLLCDATMVVSVAGRITQRPACYARGS